MIDNETPTPQPVLSKEVLKHVEEIQKNYTLGTIAEVLELLKDFYAKHTEEDADTRAGVIDTTNLVRDLCHSIIFAGIDGGDLDADYLSLVPAVA